MNRNGTLGTTRLYQLPCGSRYFCSTVVASPMAKATRTATGRLRSLAATTAVNAAAMRKVMVSALTPAVGANRIPASPASVLLTAQTPTDTRAGWTPDRLVNASESTSARTLSPTSVKRMTTVPSTRTTRTPRYVATWSALTAEPKGWKTLSGTGA